MRNLEKALDDQTELSERLQFDRDELTVALRERESMLRSLKESRGSTEPLRRQIEELKGRLIRQTGELEKESLRFKQAEQSFEKADEQLKLKNTGYLLKIKELKERVEAVRGLPSDGSLSDLSMRRVSDIVRLENELRHKNEQIQVLQTQLKGPLRYAPGGLGPGKQTPVLPKNISMALDARIRLFGKDKMKSGR